MARSSDVYTAAQAAQILGISERRVRQLVSEGKLPGERGKDNVVRIPQQAVTDERRKRRRSERGATKATPAPATAATRKSKAATPAVDMDELADKVANAVGQKISGQLEITQKAESFLRAELDEERAKRMQADAQLSEAQREAAALKQRMEVLQAELQQAQQKRGLFRRG